MIFWYDYFMLKEKEKLYTVPNMLTLYRFLSAIFIFVSLFIDLNVWYVFAVYVIAAITDKLDGILARKLNQETKLGEVLETCTDTVLTGMILVYITKNFDFPVEVLLGLFALFFVSTINMTIYFIFKKEWYSKSLITSKISVVVTFIGCALFFFDFSFNIYIAPAILIIASLAFIHFQFKLLKQLRMKKK